MKAKVRLKQENGSNPWTAHTVEVGLRAVVLNIND